MEAFTATGSSCATSTETTIDIAVTGGRETTVRLRADVRDAAGNPLAGQSVQLRYPEDNPGKAVIDGFLEKWLAVSMLSGFGILLSLVGVILLAVM